MTRAGEASASPRDPAVWAARVSCAGLLLALACTGVYAFVQAPLLQQLHGLKSSGELPGASLFFVIASTTFFGLFPALLLSSPRSGARRQAARFAVLVILTSLFFFDLAIFTSVGRHLRDTAAFLFMDGALKVAGDSRFWLFTGLRCLVYAILVALLTHGASLALEARVLRCLSEGGVGGPHSKSGPDSKSSVLSKSGLRRWVFLLGVPVWPLLALMPHAFQLNWGEGLSERIYGSLPLDLRAARGSVVEDQRTPEGRLRAALAKTHRRAFAAIEKRPSRSTPDFKPPSVRPSIVLIVVESWRADAAGADMTPRIAQWGKERALRFTHHEAGTHSSQSALFALLYGRNNLTYHQTLDAGLGPAAFEWLRKLGYRVGYFSGQPQKWIRQEEFLNPKTVDLWAHNDDGSWPEWDKRALGRVKEEVKANKAPLFAVVFLMSTHFEYQYPAKYETHLPVAHSKLWETDVAAFDASDREPHFNRYRNSLAFTDDIVMDAIEALPEDTVVLLTGDHGEAFYEGGLYGHGYSFSRAVARVPFFARFVKHGNTPARYFGPGEISGRTLHEDVLGWLMTYLLGADVSLPGFQGEADFSRVSPSRPVLSTYGRPGGQYTEAQLSMSLAERRLRLSLGLIRGAPDVRFLGFEDENAQRIPSPRLSDEAIAQIEQSFESELARASR